MKDNLKIKREERRREEDPLRTPILVPAGLLIRRGSVPEAKLRMAKRLGRARAVTKTRVYIMRLICKRKRVVREFV
jgi:hypothetical protein